MARLSAVGGAVAFLVALLPLSRASSGSTPASGVQKVIKMLTNMKTKGQQEMNDEQVAYSKFKTWCSEESASLGKQVAQNGLDIEAHASSSSKLTADATALQAEVSQLGADITRFQAEMKKETAQREIDHKNFLDEQQDYSESVDALDRAIATLRAQDYDRTGKALIQLSNALNEKERIPVKVKSIVSAFLGMITAGKGGVGGSQSPVDYQAPEANAYEFQSTSIVEMLKKLEDEFREKLGECQKEEMNSKHAYDMIMMDLKDSVENAERDSKAKAEESHRKISKSAEHKKQLAATSSMKEANEMTLKGLTQECFEKGLSFEEKQKLRTEEHEAIEKAIEILSSPEVAGSAEKYLGLAQRTPRATALVQLDRNAQAQESRGIRGKLQAFLAAEGQRLKSKPLLLLAEQAAVDPFAKVKKLIDQMITRLLEEAKQDADHEGFCDTEIGKSTVTRNRLSEEIDALSAAVEDGKATILDLTKSTEALSREVSELVTAMKEATAMREEEHKTNELTVGDAQAAQKAVAAATAVLRDFYKKAATATGFVQLKAANPGWGLKMGVKMGSPEWESLANPSYTGSKDTGHKEGMQTFGETYKGQQAEAEYGVLALLEVVQADFANLEADTKASEASSQKEYDQFMIQSKKSQAKKERKIEMNDSDKASAESQLQQDIADLKATQDELIAAEAYYQRLVPQCIDKGMTFDERTKARESEIASLREALGILGSEDIA